MYGPSPWRRLPPLKSRPRRSPIPRPTSSARSGRRPPHSTIRASSVRHSSASSAARSRSRRTRSAPSIRVPPRRSTPHARVCVARAPFSSSSWARCRRASVARSGRHCRKRGARCRAFAITRSPPRPSVRCRSAMRIAPPRSGSSTTPQRRCPPFRRSSSCSPRALHAPPPRVRHSRPHSPPRSTSRLSSLGSRASTPRPAARVAPASAPSSGSTTGAAARRSWATSSSCSPLTPAIGSPRSTARSMASPIHSARRSTS